MKIYKNKNLLVCPINEGFYSIVNPFIKDGLRVVNQLQYELLEQINDGMSFEDLLLRCSCKSDELLSFLDMLQKQEIIKTENKFSCPQPNSGSINSFTMWVHTTNNCCLRCSYCNIHTLGVDSFMRLDTIERLCRKIEETVQNNSLKHVVLRLAGGEPLLQWKMWRSPMIKLRDNLRSLGCTCKIVFLSNLVLLSNEILNWIIENNIGISVSMDGLGSFQDKSRHFKNGDGSYHIVDHNLQKLIDLGMKPMIMTVVSNNNLNGLPELTEFLIKNNLPHRYSFVQFEDLDIPLVIERMKECYQLYSKAIENGYSFSKLHHLCDLKLLNPSIQTCSNGRSGAAVYVDGDIYFCHTHFGYQPKIGSVFDSSDLIDIFHKGSYYKDDVSQDCKNCILRYVCTSGCPLERENGKDPHCYAYKQLVPLLYSLIGKEILYKSNMVYL